MNALKTCALLCIFGTALFATAAGADDKSSAAGMYEVTVTNLTRGQSFTPILAATHADGVMLFTVGEPASDALAALAEGGDTGPLDALLSASPEVAVTTTTAGLLAPGATRTFTIHGGGRYDRLSFAAMMVPTNDGFVSIQDVKLPTPGADLVLYVPARDAGSEPNDERCDAIPGPVCGGQGGSPGVGGEGYVHVHTGIHGIGDLVAAEYDWRNPVARVGIKRLY